MQSIFLLANGIECVWVVSCEGRSCDLGNDFRGHASTATQDIRLSERARG
jgi:hypothetical protein